MKKLLILFLCVGIANSSIPMAAKKVPSKSVVKPQDGRPEAPLAAYKLLTGKEEYANETALLNLPKNYTRSQLNATYLERRKQFLSRARMHEGGADAVRLLDWAYEKLDSKY